MEPLTFSYFKNEQDTRPDAKIMSWPRHCERMQRREIREEKRGGRLYSPAAYPPGKTRGNANVEEISTLIFDGDEAGNVDTHREKWDALGLAYLVYSTHSHRPEKPKWRVEFPLTRPYVVTDPEAWRRSYTAAMEQLLGSLADEKCKDPARMYYLPSCPPDMEEHAFCIVQEGRALDPAEIVVPEPEQKPDFKPAPKARKVTPDRAQDFLGYLLECALQERRAEASRHKGGLWLAQQLHWNRANKGYSEAEALSVMMQYQTQMENDGPHAYRWSEAEATFRNVFAQPPRRGWQERAESSVWTEAKTGPESTVSEPVENAEKISEMRLDNSEISELLPPPEEEENTFGNSLSGALATMEKRIRKHGGKPDAYGITIPPDADVESLIQIGNAVKTGEGRIGTILFFAWGDWYQAVQTHVANLPSGKRKGRATYILGRVYRGCPMPYIKKRRDQLSEITNTLRKIESVVTRDKRDMTRSVRFYELLSMFPPERQAHWWEHPRIVIVERDGVEQKVGVSQLMQEELIAQRTRQTVADDPEEESPVGHNASTTSPTSSEYIGKSFRDSLHFENIEASDSDERLTLSTESIALLRAMELDAVQRGVSMETYLQAKLFNETLPEPMDAPEFPYNTDFDGDLISRACVHIQRAETNTPRDISRAIVEQIAAPSDPEPEPPIEPPDDDTDPYADEYVDDDNLPPMQPEQKPVLRLETYAPSDPLQARLDALHAFVESVNTGDIPTDGFKTSSGAPVSPGWIRSMHSLAMTGDLRSLDDLEYIARQARSAPPQQFAMEGP